MAAQRALLSQRRRGCPTAATWAPWCGPDADLKVFLTASLEERARRRRADLAARGVEMDEPTVLEDVRRRDHLDTTRDDQPAAGRAGGGRDRLLRDGRRRRWSSASCAWSRRPAGGERMIDFDVPPRITRPGGRRAHRAGALRARGAAPARQRPGEHPRRGPRARGEQPRLRARPADARRLGAPAEDLLHGQGRSSSGAPARDAPSSGSGPSRWTGAAPTGAPSAWPGRCWTAATCC